MSAKMEKRAGDGDEGRGASGVAFMLRALGHFTWLPDGECYRTTFTHEMVQLDGRKMSKHLGNTVTPHEIVEQVGADTLRLAMLHAAAPAKASTRSRPSTRKGKP